MTSLPDSEASPIELVVSADEVGMRFDAFLAARIPQHSRVRLRHTITSGTATVNAGPRKASYRMRLNDLAAVQLLSPEQPGPEPENIPLDVLYEDDDLIVINKPHGMVVHPSKGHWQGTLTSALAFHFERLSQIGGETRPGIVHRLDRDTSGVIVVAKDDSAHLKLAKQFERRTVEKEYYAICHGRLDRDRDQINAPIGMHPHHREKMAVRDGHGTSRDASTFYEVKQRVGKFTVVHAFPKTGRTHQIRVHLGYLGHPIVCDSLYTGQRTITEQQITRGLPGGPILLNRMALHARRLQINHPTSGTRLEFTAPLPVEFAKFLDDVQQRLPPKRS